MSMVKRKEFGASEFSITTPLEDLNVFVETYKMKIHVINVQEKDDGRLILFYS